MVRELIREPHAAGKTVVLGARDESGGGERLPLINHGRAVLYGALAEIKGASRRRDRAQPAAPA
jgi:hypothetical protein